MFEYTARQHTKSYALCVSLCSAFALAGACSDGETSSQEELVVMDSDAYSQDETYDDTAFDDAPGRESDTEPGKSTDDNIEEVVDDLEEIEKDSETIAQADASSPFSFVVISDTHVRLPGNPDDTMYSNAENIDKLERAVEKINSEAPDAAFVAVTGDLVGCLFSEDPDDYLTGEDNPAEKFKEIMDNLLMPYHVALGNHDYEIDFAFGEGVSAKDPLVPEAIWNKVLGVEAYHSFVHHETRFVFLNSARGPARNKTCIGSLRESYCTGSFDDAQMDWLTDELSKPEQAYLFFHHPLLTDHPFQAVWSAAGASFQVQRKDAFYDIAKDFRQEIRAVFVGHGHLWARDTLYNTIDVYETGSIGDTLSNSNNIRFVQVDPSTQEFTVTKL